MNKNFHTSLAFLMDFLTDVDNLNQSLQGKGTTICFMHKKVLFWNSKINVVYSKVMSSKSIKYICS